MEALTYPKVCTPHLLNISYRADSRLRYTPPAISPISVLIGKKLDNNSMLQRIARVETLSSYAKFSRVFFLGLVNANNYLRMPCHQYSTLIQFRYNNIALHRHFLFIILITTTRPLHQQPRQSIATNAFFL